MTLSPQSNGRLAGKVALVTGGARGMGASHVRAMVAEGAAVLVTDVLHDEGRALAEELGDAVDYAPLDVTDRAAWADVVAHTQQRFGALNVLVNNAGIVNWNPIGRFTDKQWDKIIAINLTGVFNGISACTDLLVASAPSSIINISSVAGMRGYPGIPGYVAAKWGVRGLTKAVALDLGSRGVRCNSVHPGMVETPMTDGLGGQQPYVALGRMGEPRELSNLVLFLAGDESSFCTGAEFVADGGEVAGMAAGSLGPLG